MNIQRAIALAAAARESELRHLYTVAVARGAKNTGLTTGQERNLEWPRLLTLALLRTADLTLIGYLLDMIGDQRNEAALVARTAGDVSAGALRLAHRALEVHGRQVGYQTDAWIPEAVLQAAAQLAWHTTHRDEDRAVAVDEARAATASLASAAERTDQMLLAERLADALGHLLTLHAIAKAALQPP